MRFLEPSWLNFLFFTFSISADGGMKVIKLLTLNCDTCYVFSLNPPYSRICDPTMKKQGDTQLQPPVSVSDTHRMRS